MSTPLENPIDIVVREIDFRDICQVWNKSLWAQRLSPITPTSSMLPPNKNGVHYDVKIHERYEPRFFGAYIQGALIGVNSGHSSGPSHYRSRGLYVDPQYRRQGVALRLLEATEIAAQEEGRTQLWSYPRFSSWPIYEKFGFHLISPWLDGEIENNAYALKKIKTAGA